jgi:hypothetical protein
VGHQLEGAAARNPNINPTSASWKAKWMCDGKEPAAFFFGRYGLATQMIKS